MSDSCVWSTPHNERCNQANIIKNTFGLNPLLKKMLQGACWQCDEKTELSCIKKPFLGKKHEKPAKHTKIKYSYWKSVKSLLGNKLIIQMFVEGNEQNTTFYQEYKARHEHWLRYV